MYRCSSSANGVGDAVEWVCGRDGKLNGAQAHASRRRTERVSVSLEPSCGRHARRRYGRSRNSLGVENRSRDRGQAAPQRLRTLLVTSGNPYYDMQDGLLLPDPTPDGHEQQWRTTGVWAMHQRADWMFSSRQEPFLVTETNAGSSGEPWHNRHAYDGQWRQAAWALVARGARVIEYWHWHRHTLHLGAETYWGGILPHAARAGRTYAELARLGAEFATAGPLVAGLNRDADITVLYSTPSKWLMQKYHRWPVRTGARTRPRTTASSTPSTGARSRPAARSASSTPGSCTTHAANARGSPRTRWSAVTRCWSSPRCTSPPTSRSTGCPPTPRPEATWSSARAPDTPTTRPAPARARQSLPSCRSCGRWRCPRT